MKSIKNIYIFESPDNGKTVYKRLFDDLTSRELIIVNGIKLCDMDWNDRVQLDPKYKKLKFS